MRKCALLKENIIVDIRDISEEECQALSNEYQSIVDIEDLSLQPSIGWELDGNTLKAITSLSTVEEIVDAQQKNQRVFGQKLSPIVVDMMGARNLKLAREGVSINIVSLLTNLNAIKALMETGALKTARGIIYSIKPAFPVYVDILDFTIAEITAFLVDNSYE